MSMNFNYKTRYAVQKEIIANINLAFSSLNLQPEAGSTEKGWGVMEFAQASFNNADKVVLLDYMDSQRVGFQGWKYGGVLNDSTKASRTDDWLEQQTWLVHTLRRIKPSDVSATLMTCEDMADILIGWFNGQGGVEFKKHGIGTLRIDRNRIFVYNDESELYQKRAVFPLRIQVPQEISVQMSRVSEWTPGIYPV